MGGSADTKKLLDNFGEIAIILIKWLVFSFAAEKKKPGTEEVKSFEEIEAAIKAGGSPYNELETALNAKTYSEFSARLGYTFSPNLIKPPLWNGKGKVRTFNAFVNCPDPGNNIDKLNGFIETTLVPNMRQLYKTDFAEDLRTLAINMLKPGVEAWEVRPYRATYNDPEGAVPSTQVDAINYYATHTVTKDGETKQWLFMYFMGAFYDTEPYFKTKEL